jgi:hypothetical protein
LKRSGGGSGTLLGVGSDRLHLGGGGVSEDVDRVSQVRAQGSDSANLVVDRDLRRKAA